MSLLDVKLNYVHIAISSQHTRDDAGYGGLGGDAMDLGVVMSGDSIWIQDGEGTDELKTQLVDWFNGIGRSEK